MAKEVVIACVSVLYIYIYIYISRVSSNEKLNILQEGEKCGIIYDIHVLTYMIKHMLHTRLIIYDQTHPEILQSYIISHFLSSCKMFNFSHDPPSI